MFINRFIKIIRYLFIKITINIAKLAKLFYIKIMY